MRASELWLRLLLGVLLSACSIGAQEFVTVNDIEDFMSALNDTAVQQITLTADVSIPQLPNPITLTRNVTIVGNKPAAVYTYPVIDFNFIVNRLQLQPGVVLNITHVETDHTQPFVSLGIPIVALSPGGVFVFQDVFRNSPVCLPVDVRRQLLGGLARPPGYPGQQVFAEVVAQRCLGEPGTAAYECLGDYGNWTDLAYVVPENLETDQGAYAMVFENVTLMCTSYVSAACVAQQGADACYNAALAAYRASLSPQPGKQTPSGGTIAAFVGLITGLVVLCTLLGGLGFWCWRRRRRARLQDVEMEIDFLKEPEAEDAGNSTTSPTAPRHGPEPGQEADSISGAQLLKLPLPLPTLLPPQHQRSDTAADSTGLRRMSDSQHPLVAVTGPEGISLGHLIGAGSFGKVYAGYYGNQLVAVKVIVSERKSVNKIKNEVKISLQCSHVNVVKAHKIFQIVPQKTPFGQRLITAATGSTSSNTASTSSSGPQTLTTITESGWQLKPAAGASGLPASRERASRESGSGSANGTPFASAADTFAAGTTRSPAQLELQQQQQVASSKAMLPGSTAQANGPSPFPAQEEVEIWVVLEYCDMGPLSDAYIRPPFRCSDGTTPRWGVILSKARDIAKGMAYLHDLGYCHGDLKCQNVLLASSPHDPAGFVLKVADFSLSRPVSQSRTHLSTASVGTVCYMPPELLQNGHLAPYSDVYSFGIILWELVAGRRPFSGMAYANIVQKVVIDNARPKFPPATPKEISQLAQMCWIRSAQKRPSFSEIVSMIDAMLPRYAETDGTQGEWDL